jgi:tubulin alpha
MVSNVTASLRFDGALNCDLNEFKTNLLPYPPVNLLIAAYSGYVAEDALCDPSTTELGIKVYTDYSNLLITAAPNASKYMATCWYLRGDVVPKDVPCATLKTMRTV